jgi:hypothetical protein
MFIITTLLAEQLFWNCQSAHCQYISKFEKKQNLIV